MCGEAFYLCGVEGGGGVLLFMCMSQEFLRGVLCLAVSFGSTFLVLVEMSGGWFGQLLVGQQEFLLVSND